MTDKERIVIAEIFRKLSRKENLLEAEALPAKRFLVNLEGFKKVDEDVDRFFGHCFEWFLDKREQFAELPDAAVIYAVADRFKVYMKDRKAEEAKMPGQPPVLSGEDDEGNRASDDDFASTGEQRKGYKSPSLSWKDEVTPTQYAVARERTEAGQELSTWQQFLRKISWMPFVKKNFLRRLKNKKDHLGDPTARAQDAWRARDAVVKVIEEALQKKAPNKK